MKKIFQSILILVFIFSLGACDDLLEVDIKSDIVAGDFPANGEEAQALLIGSYRDLKDDMNETEFAEDRSETFDVGAIGTVSDAWAQNLNSGNGPNWLDFYSALYNINFLLSQVDDLSFNSEGARAQTKAEALFLRAYYYFYMVRIWGDVPLILEPISAAEQEVIGRTPVAQMMVQINTDVDEAISLFPSDGFGDKNRASKPAAYALKADIKMWSGKVLGGGAVDFDAALAAIDQIESAGVSLLQDDFASIFDATNRENEEIIFSIYNSRDEAVQHYARFTTPRDINFSVELSPWVPTTNSFDARHNYAPSQRIRDLFTDPNDIRKNVTAVPMYVTDGEDANNEPDTIGWSQNKFRGEIFDDIRQYTDDMIVYRWADMLLLRAEAYAAKNDIPNALAALNEVRNRAKIGDYTGPMDQTSINMAILDERGRELFLELKRWWDLRRFGADGTIDIYQFVPNLVGKETPLYWPVDQFVIALNPKIEQTTGY